MGCDIHSVAQVRDGGRWKTIETRVCDQRNYETFACLAGVRNQYGIVPICSPKGAPDDYDWTAVDLGDHTRSWHSLADLKRYVETLTTKTLRHGGYVEEREYLTAKRENRNPRSWCGNVNGPRVVKMTEEDYKAKRSTIAMPGADVHILTHWYADLLPATYLEDLVAALDVVAMNHGAGDHDVRFVFGFDS